MGGAGKLLGKFLVEALTPPQNNAGGSGSQYQYGQQQAPQQAYYGYGQAPPAANAPPTWGAQAPNQYQYGQQQQALQQPPPLPPRWPGNSPSTTPAPAPAASASYSYDDFQNFVSKPSSAPPALAPRPQLPTPNPSYDQQRPSPPPVHPASASQWQQQQQLASAAVSAPPTHHATTIDDYYSNYSAPPQAPTTDTSPFPLPAPADEYHSSPQPTRPLSSSPAPTPAPPLASTAAIAVGSSIPSRPAHLQEAHDRFGGFLDGLATTTSLSESVALFSSWAVEEATRWSGSSVNTDDLTASLRAMSIREAETNAPVLYSAAPLEPAAGVAAASITVAAPHSPTPTSVVAVEGPGSAPKAPAAPAASSSVATAEQEETAAATASKGKAPEVPTRPPTVAELAVKDLAAQLEPFVAAPVMPEDLTNTAITARLCKQAYMQSLESIKNGWYTIQGDISSREADENWQTSQRREQELQGLDWQVAGARREQFEIQDRQLKRSRRAQNYATWCREVRDKAWALLEPIGSGIQQAKASLREIAYDDARLLGVQGLDNTAWKAVFEAEKSFKYEWSVIVKQERELVKNDKSAAAWDDEADAGNPGTVWNVINQIDAEYKATEAAVKAHDAGSALDTLSDRVLVSADLARRRAERLNGLQNTYLPILAAALPTDDIPTPEDKADGPGHAHPGFEIVNDAVSFAETLYMQIDYCYDIVKEGEKAIRELMLDQENARMWENEPLAAWVAVDKNRKNAKEVDEREAAKATAEAEERRKEWESVAGPIKNWVAERNEEKRAREVRDAPPVDMMTAFSNLQQEQMKTQMISNMMWSMHASRMSVINNIGSSNTKWVYY